MMSLKSQTSKKRDVCDNASKCTSTTSPDNTSKKQKLVVTPHFNPQLCNESVTLTFGDCAVNHSGMQMLGTPADKGYSKADLETIALAFPGKNTETIALHTALSAQNGQSLAEAHILVIRKAIDSPDKLFEEMRKLSWDKMAKMRGKVVRKHARHNLCFDHFDQQPDYEAGKGTVVNIHNLPELNALHTQISKLPNSADLKIEGNHYFNLRECGVGFHGDSERAKVIGVRLGGSHPLFYRWYQDSKPISEPHLIMLNHGDLYVMSEKAVGQDWTKKKIATLRHAAGATKYTGIN
eukprot:c4911_g1_i1.p1 GENE.c4911_g1_i1~~c4911_g1_i1.p1  ORF type:complete len:294 (-),score=66.44 c4911_g1_i1:62-943(-)